MDILWKAWVPELQTVREGLSQYSNPTFPSRTACGLTSWRKTTRIARTKTETHKGYQKIREQKENFRKRFEIKALKKLRAARRNRGTRGRKFYDPSLPSDLGQRLRIRTIPAVLRIPNQSMGSPFVTLNCKKFNCYGTNKTKRFTNLHKMLGAWWYKGSKNRRWQSYLFSQKPAQLHNEKESLWLTSNQPNCTTTHPSP